jgi:2-polyprenyl-3-methyl-5-hydroxy-6-metoxy-1,4-benzoquinol methylase
MLETILNLNIAYIIIDRTPFVSGDERLTVQVTPPEIYDKSYPAWFLNEQKLFACLAAKYNRIAEFPSMDKAENIPCKYRGFVFKLSPQSMNKEDFSKTSDTPFRTANKGATTESAMTTEQIMESMRQLIRTYEILTKNINSAAREELLVELLAEYYKDKFHREWILETEKPHFSDFRQSFFNFTYNQTVPSICNFYRGFYCCELLHPNDRLLDIGCGDGFLTMRFWSNICQHIDAIDLDEKAINIAKKYNSAQNITYNLTDAVKEPFPNDKYDIIVWNGAIGHFSADVTKYMLNKIKNALAADGIFIGSESLGREGHDHLQFFYSLNELSSLLKPYFSHIEMRSHQYDIGSGFKRTEAHWRCSNSDVRLKALDWKKF